MPFRKRLTLDHTPVDNASPPKVVLVLATGEMLTCVGYLGRLGKKHFSLALINDDEHPLPIGFSLLSEDDRPAEGQIISVCDTPQGLKWLEAGQQVTLHYLTSAGVPHVIEAGKLDDFIPSAD